MDKKPPFAKINLLSRKAKDERGMASIAGGGSYQIRSRDKITDPTSPSKTLPRGSKVSVAMKTEAKTTREPGDMIPQSTTINVPEKKLILGDIPRNKVIDRKTTMETGAMSRENPAKTAVRIEAQKNGQTSYDFKGKKEYSGRIETSYKPTKINLLSKQGPDKVKTEMITKPVTTVQRPVKAKSLPITRKKQSFENTPWTGTKKDTKGYTSNPNKMGRTKVKWNGAKVKVN